MDVLIEGPIPGEFQVRAVELDPETEEKRVASICKEIKRVLRDRKETEDKIWKTAVQQYKGNLEPKEYEEGDSLLDMPTTRIKVDMATSRFMNTVFARPEVYLSKPRRPEALDFARQVEGVMDWVVDRVQFRFFVEDIVRNALIFPVAIAKVPYIHKTQRVTDWGYMRMNEEDELLEFHWGSENRVGKLIPSERFYTVESKPVPMCIPRQDFINPMPCPDINTAPWIVHRIWPSPDDVKNKIASGVYREADESGKPLMEILGRPRNEQEQQKKKQELSLSATKPSDSYGKDVYEIWEIYTCHEGEETILTVEPVSMTVLRWVYNFYFDYQRPFFTFNYERVPGDIDGISLCYILEPLHRARTAAFNLRLNAAARAMETLLLFDESTDLAKIFKEGRIRAGAWPANLMGSIKDKVEKFELGMPFSPIEGIESSLEQDADKVSGFTDYNAGLEQIKRPTASGQIALLEESRQGMYTRMENLRVFLKQVGECMLSRLRQFHPEELEYYIQSKSSGDQQMVRQVLSWPENYWRDEIYLETAVSSQSMSRDLRRQEWLALVDKMPQVFQQLMAMIQQALEPSPMSAIAAKMLTWYMKYTVQPWLQEFEVAGSEFLDFGEEMQIGQIFGQVVQELQGQIQQLDGQLGEAAGVIEELQGLLDHVNRAYVNKVGTVPPPPPASLSRGQGGPPQGAGGMEGGAPLPGGAPPGTGAGGAPGAPGEVAG